MLNFVVDDLEATVDELTSKGLKFEHYPDFGTDEKARPDETLQIGVQGGLVVGHTFNADDEIGGGNRFAERREVGADVLFDHLARFGWRFARRRSHR